MLDCWDDGWLRSDVSSRFECIKFGFERSWIVGVEMGWVGKNVNVNSVRC